MWQAFEESQFINYIFLLATAIIVIHALYRPERDGYFDWVRILMGCIAAIFFLRVLFNDVLGLTHF